MLVPLAFLGLGLWEQQRGASDEEALELQRGRMAKAVATLEARPALGGGLDMGLQFRRNGQTYVGSLALAQARDALKDLEDAAAVARLRRTLPSVVIGAAALALGLSALVLLAGAFLGWRGRASRDALVRGFSLVRRALPLLLAMQVLLAAATVVAAVAFEAAALLHAGRLSGGDVKMLGLAVLLMATSVWVAGSAVLQLRRTLAAFDPDPLRIMGRPVSRDEAPGLWRLLDDLAERLGALRPDDVVVGLTGGFFVSSGPKVLEPGGAALAGRTLYVPLPYLPLLREDEVAAIIGHELAHFSGGDTEYSLRFVPIYAGVGRSLDAVAMAGGAGSIPWLLHPALLLGVFVMDRFHHAVRHWSRLREFAADAAGAGVTSADAAARALLRTSAAQPRIDETLEAAASAPDAAPPDLVAAALRHAVARGLDDPASYLEKEQPHPTDTHPPTRQRLAALGRPPELALLAEAVAPPPPEALARLGAYFAEPNAICRAAADDFLSVMRHHARAYREKLEAAAAEVGPGESVLHENTRGGGMFVIGMGVLFMLAGLTVLALGFRGLDTTEEQGLVGVALAAGAGLVGYGILLMRRGDRPFLILRSEEMVIPGLSAPILWEHVADLDVMLHQGGVVTRLLLLPEAPLPARVPGGRRVKLDAKRRVVTLTAGLPRGMKAPGFGDLIDRYRRAAEARRLLAEGAGGAAPERTGSPDPESVAEG